MKLSCGERKFKHSGNPLKLFPDQDLLYNITVVVDQNKGIYSTRELAQIKSFCHGAGNAEVSHLKYLNSQGIHHRNIEGFLC